MIVKNACFELKTDVNFFSCEGGLYEGDRYIDTSKAEGVEMVHHDVVGTITPGEGKLPAPDFLRTFPHRCLSERAFNVFKKEGLNLWPEFQWVPVRILRQSGKTTGMYWWAKFDRRRVCEDFDVFDYEHSKYTVFPPTAFKSPPPPGVVVYDEVSKWVLRGDMIGPLDFFHACRVRWYGSSRLKQVVEKHRLQGFVFESVDLWMP